MGKVTVSIRELQHLKRLMARVERGDIVEVTRRRRPVAGLSPPRASRPLSPWPDLDARARTVFGERVITPGGADVVRESAATGDDVCRFQRVSAGLCHRALFHAPRDWRLGPVRK
jgi:antitoxin (DNA-binding transcriptional repressor) of toxin-antitoxin stability system